MGPAGTRISPEPHEVTEMAAMAAAFVNSTDRHIFLTGKAGTGKTTFLRNLAESTHKRHVILAPTGIAALNAKGVTIHSQFLLPLGSFIPERNAPDEVNLLGNFWDRDNLSSKHPLNGMRRNVLREVDLLVIDEVSMLRADLLDAVDHRMRQVKHRYDRSFGGAQVLMIGDLYQLPPVVKDHEWSVLKSWYDTPHFFAAHALRPYADGSGGFVHIELDKIFRQQDECFIRILNNFRNNTVTAEDVAELNKHYRSDVREEDEGVITLTTHNNMADDLNRAALERLPGDPHFFTADLDGVFPESMYPLPEQLELRVGAQVMFTRNDPEKAYFNGKLARIVRIEDEIIEVAMADSGLPYVLKKVRWENKRYKVVEDTKELTEDIIGTFDQYPVKLAWAITVHKSQGLTFDKAIIDVGQAFAPGQVYVALSRLRGLDGLTLRTRINANVVSSDADVVAFTAGKHDAAVLPDLLKEQQRGYLREVLANTFHLMPVQFVAERIFKAHEKAFFADNTIRQALVDLVEVLKKEGENTLRFRGQLIRLLESGTREELLTRIQKGSAYYTDLLLVHVKNTVRNTAVLSRLTGTKEYREDLDDLDSVLMKKIAEIAKAEHIAKCILENVVVSRNEGIDRKLKDRRQAILEQVAAYMVEHHPAGKGRSGRVRKAREAGAKKAAKGDSYKLSCTLHAEGLSIEEIAGKRGLTRTTIESHMAPGIRNGQVDITRLMSEEVRDAIAARLKEFPEASTKDHVIALGNAYSYGQVRMVAAWAEREP
ncbi:MAG TPA: helix-turn-helix domain-containing protein [Flavobacteriales bacterium]|nr:helix-turn-helix domain-containing protein [Flavobacteriales bacterium]